MSTDYRPLKKILAPDLLDGRLEEFGIREHVTSDSTERCKCLTDGRNFVWVYVDDDNLVSSLVRYGANSPNKILSAVADLFDTDIFSEHQPQFWGFDTQAKWDAWRQTIADEYQRKFRVEVHKYLRGEPNHIKPGTNGMIEAEIAAKLVAQDPELMLPQNEDKLFKMVRGIYDRDHTVTVTLDDADQALVRLIFTHEDDLPKG
jgi:hypothetical protein